MIYNGNLDEKLSQFLGLDIVGLGQRFRKQGLVLGMLLLHLVSCCLRQRLHPCIVFLSHGLLIHDIMLNCSHLLTTKRAYRTGRKKQCSCQLSPLQLPESGTLRRCPPSPAPRQPLLLDAGGRFPHQPILSLALRHRERRHPYNVAIRPGRRHLHPTRYSEWTLQQKWLRRSWV